MSFPITIEGYESALTLGFSLPLVIHGYVSAFGLNLQSERVATVSSSKIRHYLARHIYLTMARTKEHYHEAVLSEQLHQEKLLPTVHLHLDQLIAPLRRCKRPRMRKDRERKIGQVVTAMIETEAELISQQTRKQHLLTLYNAHSAIHARLEYRYQFQHMHHTLPSAPQDSRVQLLTHRLYPAVFAPDPCLVYWLEKEAIATDHVFRRSNLGYENCKELAETCYRESEFIFEDGMLIGQFLEKDFWFFDLRPRDLVRRVTIRIPEAIIRQRVIDHHSAPN
jgi:hypothetical protein